MPDLIADFIDRMLAADPNIRIDVADRVRYQLRVDYGGQRVKIPKAPAEVKEIGLRLGLLDRRGLSARTRRRYD
jgi:hypothetical protein